MKVQKGLIVAIVSSGLAVALWAALAVPTAKDAPKLPDVATGPPAGEAVEQAEDEASAAADRRSARSDADAVVSDESTSQAVTVGDASAVGAASSGEVGGTAAGSKDHVLGSRRSKLKDPRSKYCPPAARYGDKPRKGCIGDY